LVSERDRKENEKKVRWDRLPLSALPMTTLNIVEYERALEVSARSQDGSMSPTLSPTMVWFPLNPRGLVVGHVEGLASCH
jgi:hypothetical protein